MNDVPTLFFEQVAFQFLHSKTLSRGSALSGLPGHVASEFYAKRSIHGMWLRNGRLEQERNVNCEHQQRDIETLSRKHLRYIGIAISADKKEYNTDPDAIERVLSATKGKHVLLTFETPNISEEIAKCVLSLRFVYDLQLCTKITSEVLKTTRSLVEKNTLNTMSFGDEISDGTTQLLVDLLKQKQFNEILLPAKCSAVLQEIIASWKENSSEMARKKVYCKEGFSKLQLSSTEFPFEECTEEEECDARRVCSFLSL